MSLYEIISVVLAAGLITVTALSLRANHKLSLAEKRLGDKLEQLKAYGKLHSIIEYTFQDIVFLGPHGAGKTSVAELWTKPWFDIGDVTKTEYWNKYEASIFDIGSETRFDPLFGVERTYQQVLRVRVYDYPGDDHNRNLIINQIPKLRNAVIILFFNIKEGNADHINDDADDLIPIDDNNSYYSHVFMERIEHQKNISENVSKVIVVFNKIDVLPQQWNQKTMLQKLKKANPGACRRIDELFSGKLEYYLVSARDNRRLISLLGAAGSAALPKAAQQRFVRQIEQITRKDVRA